MDEAVMPREGGSEIWYRGGMEISTKHETFKRFYSLHRERCISLVGQRSPAGVTGTSPDSCLAQGLGEDDLYRIMTEPETNAIDSNRL